MKVHVRRATTKAQIETARTLDRRIFVGDDPYESARAEWWLAEAGSYAVGFCALAPCRYEPHTYFLARAGVVHSARGHGLQTRLIRVRERRARQLGGTRLITYVHPHNMASANNLIKCGFRLYAPANPWGVESAIYFYKDL